jgi:putative transposase
MIDPQSKTVSLSHQYQLLSLSCSSWYYEPKGESFLNLTLMRLIDEQFLKTLYYGSRQMARHVRRIGYCVGRKRIRRLMRLIGLEAIYQSPKTSTPHPDHKVYPYLLKGTVIVILRAKSMLFSPDAIYKLNHLHDTAK